MNSAPVNDPAATSRVPDGERGRDEERVGGVEEAVVGVALAGRVAGVADGGGDRGATARGEGEQAGGQRRGRAQVVARARRVVGVVGELAVEHDREHGLVGVRGQASCRTARRSRAWRSAASRSAELVKPSEGLDSDSVAGPAAVPVRRGLGRVAVEDGGRRGHPAQASTGRSSGRRSLRLSTRSTSWVSLGTLAM